MLHQDSLSSIFLATPAAKRLAVRLRPSAVTLIFAFTAVACGSPTRPSTTFWRLSASATDSTSGCVLQIYSLMPGMQAAAPWEGRAQIGFLRARRSSTGWEHVADTTLLNALVRVDVGSSDSIRVSFEGPPADTLSGLVAAVGIDGAWSCDARWPASGGQPLIGGWSLFRDLPD